MAKTIWSDGKDHCRECGRLIGADEVLFMDGLCEECEDELNNEEQEDD
jgi:predicted nucleic acid-binding Zn ribbon protein